jgi:hypothetical protein
MKNAGKIVLLPLTLLATLIGCDDAISAMHGGGGDHQTESPKQSAAAPGVQQRLSIDTTLGELARNAEARAVVDRYLPGVMGGPHGARAAEYSPRQIQAQMPNLLTEDQLAQMGAELAAIR